MMATVIHALTTIGLLLLAFVYIVLAGLCLIALFAPDDDAIDPMQQPFGDVPEVRP